MDWVQNGYTLGFVTVGGIEKRRITCQTTIRFSVESDGFDIRFRTDSFTGSFSAAETEALYPFWPSVGSGATVVPVGTEADFNFQILTDGTGPGSCVVDWFDGDDNLLASIELSGVVVLEPTMVFSVHATGPYPIGAVRGDVIGFHQYALAPPGSMPDEFEVELIDAYGFEPHRAVFRYDINSGVDEVIEGHPEPWERITPGLSSQYRAGFPDYTRVQVGDTWTTTSDPHSIVELYITGVVQTGVSEASVLVRWTGTRGEETQVTELAMAREVESGHRIYTYVDLGTDDGVTSGMYVADAMRDVDGQFGDNRHMVVFQVGGGATVTLTSGNTGSPGAKSGVFEPPRPDFFPDLVRGDPDEQALDAFGAHQIIRWDDPDGGEVDRHLWVHPNHFYRPLFPYLLYDAAISGGAPPIWAVGFVPF